MQSLCTLRHRCRQRSRNTRYQADATPYLDRSSTGWIAPACLAHLLDHLVSAQQERRGNVKPDSLGATPPSREWSCSISVPLSSVTIRSLALGVTSLSRLRRATPFR